MSPNILTCCSKCRMFLILGYIALKSAGIRADIGFTKDIKLRNCHEMAYCDGVDNSQCPWPSPRPDGAHCDYGPSETGRCSHGECVPHCVLLDKRSMVPKTIEESCSCNIKTCRTRITAEEKLLDILQSDAYNSKLPPPGDRGKPAVITVQLVVLSIDNVAEHSMDYSMTIFLRQQWVDKRLSFNASEFGHNHTDDRVELDPSAVEMVWHPDTYFYNERKAYLHDITVPNKLTHIFPNGTVMYSIRISMTLVCHMNLVRYPFDRQVCPVILASYGHTSHVIKYMWHPQNVVVKSGVELPTFDIDGWEKSQCDDINDGVMGDFSCLSTQVAFRRSYGFYIAHVYVPSVMIVTLSWVNFWLDIDATPARVSLGLLCVLSKTTMSAARKTSIWDEGITNSLPRVSYVKAIDTWLAVCLLFVFLALLEFALVNVKSRVHKRRMSRIPQKNSSIKAGCHSNCAYNGEVKEDGVNAAPARPISDRELARRVDRVSRWLFPLFFLIFNTLYWPIYLVYLE